MHTFTDVLLEMEIRKKEIETEIERIRWARLAAEARPQTRREWGIWRMVIGLHDRLLEIRCEVQSLFAANPRTTAC